MVLGLSLAPFFCPPVTIPTNIYIPFALPFVIHIYNILIVKFYLK